MVDRLVFNILKTPFFLETRRFLNVSYTIYNMEMEVV